MKLNKSFIWSLLLLTVIAALYRVIPNRPWGFAPQLAMALFAGAVIRDKKWAVALPVLSMFVSDLLYQVLYAYHLTPISGFYKGQWINYILFASVVVVGFFVKKINVQNIFIASLIAPTYFFIVSNFLTWMGVGEFVEYPKTWGGLMSCYTLALPFYKMSIIATLVFSAVLFGSYYLIRKNSAKTVAA
ncbi:MAG: hypothetical protein JST96_01365 [Bacteroidetes bacterium]|nr:hypothetical protein [Bacteroidota bacterium]